MKSFGTNKKEKIKSVTVSILLLSAVVACDINEDEENHITICPYVYATYELNGVVTNDKSQAVNSAQVIITGLDKFRTEIPMDTLTTDASGLFHWEQTLTGYRNDFSLLLQIRDQKQQYQELSDTISFKNSSFANAEGEFFGKATENISAILHKNND